MLYAGERPRKVAAQYRISVRTIWGERNVPPRIRRPDHCGSSHTQTAAPSGVTAPLNRLDSCVPRGVTDWLRAPRRQLTSMSPGTDLLATVQRSQSRSAAPPDWRSMQGRRLAPQAFRRRRAATPSANKPGARRAYVEGSGTTTDDSHTKAVTGPAMQLAGGVKFPGGGVVPHCCP
jgi:hypothetical protein